jgi:hypothetical protein
MSEVLKGSKRYYSEMEKIYYDVVMSDRSAIKSQVIADFITEWTKPSSYTEGLVPKLSWLIYCDRALGNVRAGATSILISPS